MPANDQFIRVPCLQEFSCIFGVISSFPNDIFEFVSVFVKLKEVSLCVLTETSYIAYFLCYWIVMVIVEYLINVDFFTIHLDFWFPLFTVFSLWHISC